MNGDQPITWLMFFTLVAAIAVAAGGFLYFLRSQRNRDIAADALTGDDSKASGSMHAGALPELVGAAAIGLIAMGLLTAGYKNRSSFETAQATTPVGTTGMTQAPGTADKPKPYQPANPSPDLRAAPTSSDTGVGPENGSTGTNK